MDMMADWYPNISDHGLIGDLQTAALVTTDGTIDWFCCPRFDSPSIFASLLDADRGGYFRISPDRDDYVSKQLYLPDNALLITRFMTPDGVGEVQDFMPVIEGRATDRHRLVRKLRVARGTMRFVVDIQPRFDYGRAKHTIEVSENGAVFRSGTMELTLHTSGRRDPGDPEAANVERVGDGLRESRAAGQQGEGGDSERRERAKTAIGHVGPIYRRNIRRRPSRGHAARQRRVVASVA